jgi:thymidylate synthase (FAD)
MEIKEVKPSAKLIAYTKTIDNRGPEAVVAAAAKLCYSKTDASTLLDNSTPEKDAAFIERLNSLGHESPYEHATFTFAIEGISRACSHQLVRHRIASYSQQSQRYVDLSDTFSVVVPDEIKNDPKAYAVFMESIKKDIADYITIKDELTKKYDEVNDAQSKASLKKAIENARYLLPNACETKVVMTMNARSLNNFFKERCCNRAQDEIRSLAYIMLDEVLDVAPDLFINSGAPCIKGPCPEGKMTCGHPQKRLVKQIRSKNER